MSSDDTGRLGDAAVPVRLLMALSVAVSHSFTLAGHDDPLLPNAGFGSLGVVGFFALSGFLVTGSALRLGDRPRFLWHRFLRIYPAYWVCLLVTAFGFGLALGGTPGQAAGYVLENATIMVHRLTLSGEPSGVPVPGQLNGALWTLGVEVICYLVVALTMARRRAVAPMAALFLFVALCAARTQGAVYPQYELALAFAIGATLRLYRFPRTTTVLAASGVVTVVAIAAGWWLPVALPALCVFVLNLADRPAPVIPDLSYGFYLYAFPVQQTLVVAGLREPLLILALTIVGAGSLAWLSHRFIEEPARRLRGASLPHSVTRRFDRAMATDA
jgi:peptidoglycan/LPS O-acetylase OafA/YrhL